MLVAGVDGCRAGWVAFKVEVPSLTTSVDVADLREVLGKPPADLAWALNHRRPMKHSKKKWEGAAERVAFSCVQSSRKLKYTS